MTSHDAGVGVEDHHKNHRRDDKEQDLGHLQISPFPAITSTQKPFVAWRHLGHHLWRPGATSVYFLFLLLLLLLLAESGVV